MPRWKEKVGDEIDFKIIKSCAHVFVILPAKVRISF